MQQQVLDKIEHRLSGACVGYLASDYALKIDIEQTLKDELSDVQEVVAVDE